MKIYMCEEITNKWLYFLSLESNIILEHFLETSKRRKLPRSLQYIFNIKGTNA